jgi:hypothetical protein
VLASSVGQQSTQSGQSKHRQTFGTVIAFKNSRQHQPIGEKNIITVATTPDADSKQADSSATVPTLASNTHCQVGSTTPEKYNPAPSAIVITAITTNKVRARATATGLFSIDIDAPSCLVSFQQLSLSEGLKVRFWPKAEVPHGSVYESSCLHGKQGFVRRAKSSLSGGKRAAPLRAASPASRSCRRRRPSTILSKAGRIDPVRGADDAVAGFVADGRAIAPGLLRQRGHRRRGQRLVGARHRAG